MLNLTTELTVKPGLYVKDTSSVVFASESATLLHWEAGEMRRNIRADIVTCCKTVDTMLKTEENKVGTEVFFFHIVKVDTMFSR